MPDRPPPKSTAPAPHQAGAPEALTAQFESMIAVHRHMVERLGTINRMWLDAVQEAGSTGADLAARLAHCSNPAEGVGLWNEWMRERAARFASGSREASEIWKGLYGSAPGPSTAPAPGGRARHDRRTGPKTA